MITDNNTMVMFKDIIEEKYGIHDIPSYNEFKRKEFNAGIDDEKIDLLSPDNINSSSFWEYIEKHPELAKDAICFGATGDVPIEQVNAHNLNLAFNSGVLNYVFSNRGVDNITTLDIGAGYGVLKNFIEQETKHKYVGVDVYPKIEGIYSLEDNNSLLPKCIRDSKFPLVISTNVFQHLSINQRRHYYEQISNLLVGIFSFNIACNTPERKLGFKHASKDKYYTCHYGQYTEVQLFDDVVSDLKKHFNILAINNITRDNIFTFHCINKEPSVDFNNG